MMSQVLSDKERDFIDFVTTYYRRFGRHDLPWRHTKDPYYILVSEMMLQQTQVARVIPKYEAFVTVFPTVTSLAEATLGDVLHYWQGLGYNRRAKYLHETAKQVKAHHNGVFPTTATALRVLPGIGPYTAGAVAVFAYDAAEIVIETNIRTAYIHHFFTDDTAIPDAALEPYLVRTLQTPTSMWYAALMDYGAHVKTKIGNKNRQSKSYQRQLAFEGSDRQIRGAIIRTLLAGRATKQKLLAILQQDEKRVGIQLASLQKDGLVLKEKQFYRLP